MQKLAAGAIAVVAVGVAGGAVAATRLGNPDEERRAVVNDAARRLGVTPQRLTDALKDAMKARVDAAVEAGRLSEAEGNRMKERIDDEDFPVLGPGGRRGFHGHHGPGFHGLDAAADYLGMTESALRDALQDGKTLAQVANDRNKSVDGLVNALVAEKKARIDEAVEDGDLTRAQANELLEDLRSRTTDMVNGRMPARPDFKRFHSRGPPDRPALSVTPTF